MCSSRCELGAESGGRGRQAAEADGEVDEREQAEIDAARRQVDAMREKQEQLRRREAEKAQRQAGGKGVGKAREEKVRGVLWLFLVFLFLFCSGVSCSAEEVVRDWRLCMAQRGLEGWCACVQFRELRGQRWPDPRHGAHVRIDAECDVVFGRGAEGTGGLLGQVMISIAAKETAAERLRLATELRELKDKFLRLSNANHKVRCTVVRCVVLCVFCVAFPPVATSRPRRFGTRRSARFPLARGSCLCSGRSGCSGCSLARALLLARRARVGSRGLTGALGRGQTVEEKKQVEEALAVLTIELQGSQVAASPHHLFGCMHLQVVPICWITCP